MDIDPERPNPVKYSPEMGTPVGDGTRWPGWLLAVALILLILFVVWTQGWRP